MGQVIPRSKADLDDQRWLDQQVEAIAGGADAVIDVLVNWYEFRNLSRLHPGVEAFDYLKAHVPQLHLTRADVPALIEGTNLSFSAIAQLTGTSPDTVATDAEKFPKSETPRVGVDGKPAKGGRPRKPKPEPEPELPVLEGEVIEPDETPEPDLAALDAHYINALRKYVAGVVNVTAPAVGRPPLMQKRRAIERALQHALTEFIGRN